MPAIWGDGSEVLWAEGEPLVIAAPPGVGKTTLAGQLLGGLLGLRPKVLRWSVQPARRVLYVASDRPAQAMRSMRRQFTEDDRKILDDRLIVWKGPPPADFGRETMALVELCRRADADAVILDSLKDMAMGLTDDAVGSGLNQALQNAVAEGIEVCSLHHQRKGRDGVKPKSLEDVYGSTWITAGAGSVILLWGSAGDFLVELIHLKQPMEQIGPLKVEHNHAEGTSIVYRGFDLLRFLQGRGKLGATATDVAKAWYEKGTPTDNEKARARYALDKLHTAGLTIKESASLGSGGGVGAIYKATEKATEKQVCGDNPENPPRPPRTEPKGPGQATENPAEATETSSHRESPTPLEGGDSVRPEDL